MCVCVAAGADVAHLLPKFSPQNRAILRGNRGQAVVSLE